MFQLGMLSFAMIQHDDLIEIYKIMTHGKQQLLSPDACSENIYHDAFIEDCTLKRCSSKTAGIILCSQVLMTWDLKGQRMGVIMGLCCHKDPVQHVHWRRLLINYWSACKNPACFFVCVTLSWVERLGLRQALVKDPYSCWENGCLYHHRSSRKNMADLECV